MVKKRFTLRAGAFFAVALGVFAAGAVAANVLLSVFAFVPANSMALVLADSMPVFSSAVSDDAESLQLAKISRVILGFDVSEPRTILQNQIASIKFGIGLEASGPQPTDAAVPTELPADMKPVIALDMHPDGGEGYLQAGGVMIKNHTTYTPDPTELLAQDLSFNLKESGPKVLITHAHSSEAYTPTDSDFYNPSDPSRTQDMRYTVMHVGEEMAKVLNDMGISTVQDRAVHDYPSYNGSYKSSLAEIQKYLQEYPSIRVVLDVHRDAMQRDDGTRLKDVTEINDEKVAQIMLVTGTDQAGLSHPNWQSGLKFAMKWQSVMNSDYPRLTRAIDFRQERFNTHATLASVIVEVGSVANTLDEAVRGGKYAAESLGKMLKTLI
ncbi:MAG: stage II sporulation protein P [Clostridiales bacterium]|jgi:stage II sporulation protein P|nr:stage II sporulation protein P [Clostridiales bacterium]